MSDTDKTGQIYKQIAAIMGAIPAIGKDRQAGSGGGEYGYKFRGIDDIYNAMHPLLAAHKVFPMPEVLEVERTKELTAKGKPILHTKVKVKYTFYAEDGSSVACVVIGEGMDSGDKSGNKAMSGAEKYAFFQVFCIPTDEPKDSENDSPEIAPSITVEELIAKIGEAKAMPHLANIWEKYGDDMKLMSPTVQAELAAAKNAKKMEIAGAAADLNRGDGQGSLVPEGGGDPA